jgi:hypothetical protein
MKAKALRNLRVTRVDLVKNGASVDPTSGEGSHVLIFKSADPVSKDDDDTDDDTEKSISCAKCSTPMAKAAKFCGECGAAKDGYDATRTAKAQIDDLIATKVAKGVAKSHNEALVSVMRERPDLYEQYRAEAIKGAEPTKKQSAASMVVEMASHVRKEATPDAATLSRLFRERPDLHERYRAESYSGIGSDDDDAA